MNAFNHLLSKALQENHLTVSAEAKTKLIHYLELIQKWNRVFNLTTITQPQDMIYLHLIDSLMIAPFLAGHRFLDVGTGAGLPGIPLAIYQPEHQWVLLDKNSKKTRFLTQVVAELGLSNVEVVHARSEDYHPPHCFDNILSRALGSLKLFTDTTQHLLCPQGFLIAMKGKYPQEELDDLQKPSRIQKVTRYTINGLNIERHIICIKGDLVWEK